jgi:hypothetical protein
MASPPPTDKPDTFRTHAAFHARESPSGIGAAVIRSYYDVDREVHIWECVVSDGREWHYVRVLGQGLGPYTAISNEDVEAGIARFAGTLPEPYRIRHLLNANPLHIDREGVVSD